RSANQAPCNIFAPGGVVTVLVMANTNPAGTVFITVPDPPSAVLINEYWWFPYTGDRINGMTMDLGCTGGDLALGTLTYFFVANPGADISWTVGANSVVTDCDGNPQLSQVLPSQINGFACFQNCMGLAPYDLYPPDGAGAVALNVELTWEGGWGFQLYNCAVRIGTSPDCSDAQVITVPCDGANSIAPSFLQPLTTYYWQASWDYTADGCSSGDFGVSPVHSFTTEGPVSVQPSTWGRVKAMYRE
ncbi:MAG TPA: hypothetical protein VFU38_09610, partial [Candidatus Krumholzibacteria bacterium]|nr:hypothetical protein [Candidatus Krumholzibacteria bacterium]